VFDGGTDDVVVVAVDVEVVAVIRVVTTADAPDVAVAEPFLLLATTVTRSVFPTSAATTR
jgi:hypothetical protein